ncbi:MAG: T9SS type A sorting domain-containing protein [Ignavibacteriaceae bacterium]
MKYISLFAMYLITTLVIVINPTIAQVRYKVIDIGTLGGNYTYASDLNDSMQVVGYSQKPNSDIRGFIWQNGTMTELSTLGGNYSAAQSINNTGKITGTSNNSDNYNQAVVWDNGNISTLGTLGGVWSQGYGNNDPGSSVGYSPLSSDTLYAFIWQNGNITSLGALDDDMYSIAFAVNNNNQAVGYSQGNSGIRAFISQNNGLIDLGSLGGGEAIAYDINNAGQIVGTSATSKIFDGIELPAEFIEAGFLGNAFIWENGSMNNLGTLGGNGSRALGINDSGVVVGGTLNASEQFRAFIWENDEMLDLNDLIDTDLEVELSIAIEINNEGAIITQGTLNGITKPFLLIPKRYPVLIVPGIAGTYSSSILFDVSWLINRGLPPNNYQVDPLGKVYHDIIKTFENVGYKKDTTLFVVNYDWRLTPGPIDNNIDGKIDSLTGVSITNNQFKYGVDYLGWYIKQASERWREIYDEDLDSIDVIAHSTGGLVTRTYIQSDAYGDVYNISENYKLPKIRNFVMIGVPNRGASKAWNPIHDNWIADPVYAFVLSKILNRAYQKLKLGFTIYGPDYDITYLSILNQGVPDLNLFIDRYVPTIRYLLATYNFLDLGNGFNNVNEDPDVRNTIVLDLNNGYDLMPNSSPNDFLDSTKATVIYGTGQSTKVLVQKRNDFQLAAVQSFTDWAPMPVLSGTDWYEDLETTTNGDGTVPIISSANQFSGDSRANLIPYSSGDHTSLVSKEEVQKDILNLFNQNFTDDDISTGSSVSVVKVLCVISDPVELFVTDGAGRRLGYSNSTGAVTEIPNSFWTGDTDGMGYVFDSVQEPINLRLTGLGEDYYVMVSIQDSGRYGGVVLEGFLAEGEEINYQITLDPLSVNESDLTPDNFALSQNYPNPFNPTTTIQYSIPERSNVILKVYDILGKEVASLVREVKDRGIYSVNFDGSFLASGLYVYRLSSGSFVQSKKMLLLK